MFKKFLSLFLAVLMVTGMFPITALADAQPTQSSMSKGVYLAIYEGKGDFPGEPATHGSAASYVNFTSSFDPVSYNYRDSSAYVTNATGVISSDILNAITEGADGTWGYVKTSGNGVSNYIIDANIKNRENVKKMIRAVDGYENATDAELENLDILWYVIKKQAGGWFSDDYWHIDGLVVNKTTYYVSYEGNGATGGEVPSGVNKIDPGTTYKIQGIGSLTRKVDGFKSKFVGWCENPDGSTKIYQPGETITVNKNTTFYAIWEDQAVHDVTINVYLDNIKAQVGTVHNNASDLYIKTETGSEYIKLSNTGTGVYTTEVSGNGNYYVYHNHNGEWEQITENFITVYNKDASMDINHYSVAYDLGGGSFASGENNKYNAIYSAGKPVSVTSEVPTKTVDGVTYYFNGWRDNNGNVFSAGENVTFAISAPITLSAQWKEPAKAKVNVTIDRNGGGGFDNSDASKEAEFIFRHIHGTATDFPSVSLTPESHNGYTYISNENTHIATYTANNWTYLNLEPSGEYTVYAEKEGYIVTKEVSGSHSEGWVINLGFKYAPEDFTLHYDAVVEDNVPQNIYPEAVNVKVTYWGYDVNNVLGWHVISQQLGNGTEKPLYINPVTKRGTSNYPVWKFWADSTEPYYYRVEVVSFVMPDGNTVIATKDSNGVYNSTNGLYSAVVSIENGGGVADYPEGTSSVAPGAYFDANSVQNGRPTITISANSFNVTFDANGGLVNGKATDTASNVFAIPDFDNYTATRGDGYTFGGWYTDKECTVPAQEGKILSGNATLYAKWKAPLTITGDVTIHGTYLLGENTIEINPVDKPRKATVILRKAGSSGSVANSLIEFDWGTDFGADSATKSYSFTMLPDDGSTYYIDIRVNNYTTTYRNDGENGTFAADKSTAIFAPNSKTATVDAVLDFTPGSYTQKVVVDATDIAKDFRPKNSISAEILYRNMGSNTVFDVISQHKTPDGRPLSVTLEENGKGEASEIIWKQFYDGTAYEYQVRIPGKIEDLPCYVTYGNTAHWNGIEASGTLYAYIKANTYDVTFDYNDDNATESKTVYGMHKWSYPTEITEVPTREGYVFGGWECTTAGVSFNSETVTIGAEVHENVTLKAKWLTDSNKDEVPDIYQKKVTFKIVNGTWDGNSTEDEIVWVTLYGPEYEVEVNGITEKRRDWSENGTGTLEDSSIPTEMEPNPGYGDGQWYKESVSEETEVEYISKEVTEDVTYIYSFAPRTNLSYTVNYYLEGTTTSVSESKTVIGNADDPITLGDRVEEQAVTVEGYNAVDPTTKTIIIGADENVINFYYTIKQNLNLDVHHIWIDENNSQNNVHLESEPNILNNMKYGDLVNIDLLVNTYDGYTVKKENISGKDYPVYVFTVDGETKATTGQEVKIGDGSNVVHIFYEKKDFAYRVEYYFDGVLDETRNFSAPFASSVSADYDFAVDKGQSGKFVFDHAENNPLTITSNPENNVIRIYYLSDKNNNEIPDVYEASVTYHIINGYWSGNDNAVRTATFNMKRFDTNQNIWVDTNPTLANPSNGVNIPTGTFVPATSFSSVKSGWDETPTANTKVFDGDVYNYIFSESNTVTISANVTNGTVIVKETIDGTETTKTGQNATEYVGTPGVDNDANNKGMDTTVMTFAPNSNKVTLDYVRVTRGTNTVVYSGQTIMGWGEGNSEITFNHNENGAIVVVYSEDKNENKVPDRFEKKVTFRIENGSWQDGGSVDLPVYLPLYDENGNWSESGSASLIVKTNETGKTAHVPAGMIPSTGYDSATGEWDNADINSALKDSANVKTITLSGNAEQVYTYSFDKIKVYLDFGIENGTANMASAIESFDYDGNRTFDINTTANSGYILERVVVGKSAVSPADAIAKAVTVYEKTSATPTYTSHDAVVNSSVSFDYKQNTYIRVYYTRDVDGGENGDGTPDKYQQKVVYKIKNGTWYDDTTADKFEWVTLFDTNGNWSETGTGTSTVPTGMKAAQHYDVNRGSWNVEMPQINNDGEISVSKADGDIVYTYDFVKFEYGTTEVPYTVEHYKQNVDGTYPETPSEVVTGKVVLNTTDGKINTEHDGTKVTGTAKEYAHFLAGTSVVPGTSVTPIDLETVEKTLSISSDRLTASFEPIRFYYARDKHTVSYDKNLDVDAEDVFEADKTYNDIICGSKVKTEKIPAKRGYIFKGWEDISSGDVYKAESEITVNKNYELKAKWEIQTGIEYTVSFLEENTGKVLAESIKGTATFGDTIFASAYNGTEIAGYAHVGQNKDELVIDVGSGANILNIYYSKDVIGGGKNYDEGDDIADKYQVTVEYKVSPADKGEVTLKKEVITIYNSDQKLKPIMRGTVTISGSEVTPNAGWTLLSWNGTDNSAVETVDANGNKNVLAAKEIEVVGGSTYTFTAVLVPKTTEVEPSGAVYKVEHYKWNTETGSYELSETEMLMGEIGKTVTALGKDYEGFCVNPNVAEHKPSGVVTLPVLEDGEIKDLLVLKLYYDIDVIGEKGEEPDKIPDIYQKKVTFRVRNGYWEEKAKATNDRYDEIVVYLTLLDENGNMSTEGTAKLVVPTGMTPNRGYGRGRWLKTPPEYVSGTNHEIYTYMFYPLGNGRPQDIVVIPEREEAEINPGTGAPILG